MSVRPVPSRVFVRPAATILVALVGSGAPELVQAQSGITSCVSLDANGMTANGFSGYSLLSSDGRYVAFYSAAATFVPGDTNGQIDVFRRDRLTDAITRVSVDSFGAQSNGMSLNRSLSADARWVGFDSQATNLVLGDTTAGWDAFVHDVQTGQTVRVSVDSLGVQGNDDSSFTTIAANGRYVAFASLADNLVAGDTNGTNDVFVRDLQAGTTVRVSVSSSGVQGNLVSGLDAPAISADGSFVCFGSWATNLVSGDTNGGSDVFRHDLASGLTTLVSVNSLGVQGDAGSNYPALSANGRFLAFASGATNLVVGDLNGAEDVFARDLQNGTTERVSVDSFGNETWFGTTNVLPALSADGRFVAFESNSPNLAPGIAMGLLEVYVHDQQTGATDIVSVDSAGQHGGAANGYSLVPSIDATGRYVAFESVATGLVSGDNNGTSDVFVRDTSPPSATNYCTGKVNSLGCVPAIALSIAPSAGAGVGCTLSVVDALGNKTGRFFHSTFGPQAMPLQGGLLCVRPPLKRHPLLNSGGVIGTCTGTYSEDFNAYIATHADPALVAGADVWLQAWSRDPGDPFTISLTDAVTATIQP